MLLVVEELLVVVEELLVVVEELVVLVVEELLLLLELPLHDSPQIVATSVTQLESQEVVQQYGSMPVAQILVTHGSQPLVSLAPAVHSA